MPPLDSLMVEAIPMLALAVLLLCAYAHPRPSSEAAVALGAAAAALGAGSLGSDEIRSVLDHLLPVVGFLAAILVVSEVCSRAGLFAAAAGLLTRRPGDPARLLTTAFVLAASTTAVLSLDATVVLLTPVVVAAAAATGTSPRPGAFACLRMANSASLLLPVSNLTNLLALSSLDLTFVGFAWAMLPVLVVVLLIEYAGLRLILRGELRAAAPHPRVEAVETEWPVAPAAVVALMLVAFGATSPLGLDPFWVAATAAVVLAVWGIRRGVLTPTLGVRAAHLEFGLFVLSLGVVVAAISAGFLGDAVAEVVPTDTSFSSLLIVAVVATALANTLTNLSAALLWVPLVAPLGNVAVLAALLGLNIGSGLTFTGSLANLLWRRTLQRHGERAGFGGFHRVSLLLTPVSLLGAVVTLSLTSH